MKNAFCIPQSTIRNPQSALLLLLLFLNACATASKPNPVEPPLPAPTGKVPNLTIQLPWSGAQVTLPPPIDADKAVFQTPQYRNWQYRGVGDDFTFTDASSFKYSVQSLEKIKSSTVKPIKAKSSTSGGGKKKGGKSKKKKPSSSSSLASNGIRMIVTRFRPDGTMENVTNLRTDGSIDGWTAYGPDGQARLVKVQMRGRQIVDGVAVPLISYVNFYDPDRIRQIHLNQRNVAWQELVVTESGAIKTRLHEDPSKADQLEHLGEGKPVKPLTAN